MIHKVIHHSGAAFPKSIPPFLLVSEERESVKMIYDGTGWVTIQGVSRDLQGACALAQYG
jgi:hypothetical protein